jgi:hypothetical protein
MMAVVEAWVIFNDVRVWRVRRRTDYRSAEILPITGLLGEHFNMSARLELLMRFFHLFSLARGYSIECSGNRYLSTRRCR